MEKTSGKIDIVARGLSPYVPEAVVPSNVEVVLMDDVIQNVVYTADDISADVDISSAQSSAAEVSENGNYPVCSCNDPSSVFNAHAESELDHLAGLYPLSYVDLLAFCPDLKLRRITNLNKLRTSFVVQTLSSAKKNLAGKIIRGEKGFIRPFLNDTVVIILPKEYVLEFESYLRERQVDFKPSCVCRKAAHYLIYLKDVEKVSDYLKLRKRRKKNLSLEAREKLKLRAAHARQSRFKN